MSKVTVEADDENCAEVFWEAFTEAYPFSAAAIREVGQVTVDVSTWELIQKLEGFRDGPYYAPTALVVKELYHGNAGHPDAEQASDQNSEAT